MPVAPLGAAGARSADRKPLTRIRITPAGRRAFAVYLVAMGRLIGSRG